MDGEAAGKRLATMVRDDHRLNRCCQRKVSWMLPVRLNAEEGLTQRDKTHYVKDDVGVEVLELQHLVEE